MFSLSLNIGPLSLNIYLGRTEKDEVTEGRDVTYSTSTPAYIDANSLSCIGQGWHFAAHLDDEDGDWT